MRRRVDQPSDSGQISVALAAGAAGLLLLTALFIGAVSTSSDAPTACQLQPPASSDAHNGIPATYLAIYQKTGHQTGIAWNLLAAIGKIESDHGRDPGSGVHDGANYAGAAGPMQIGIGGAAGNNWGGAPRHRTSTHTNGYGTDGNHDGWEDVHDPADAIPAAAKYLKDHGAPTNIRKAVFAYNPATSYVNTVLAQAARYARNDAQAVTVADNPDCAQNGAGPPPTGRAAKIIAFARAQLGKPYVFGAEGPGAFDCSGLTMRAYQAAGISIPRTADVQYHQAPKIPKGSEQPGDLVFFNYRPGMSGPGHVGIVISSGRMIEARCTHCGPIAINPYTNRSPVGFARPN